MEPRHIKPKENALVVRHNKLIEARYATSLQQQRIMLWLISELRPEDRDFQTYRVSIKELARFVGIDKNKNIYQELAGATKGMIGKVLEIGSIESKELLQVGLISSAKYKIGEGFLDLAISPELMPYLLELKANFTTALLRDLMAMKSAYSIRLYDLLNQYRTIGTRTLDVEELKRLFKMEKKYSHYGHFKTRVIAPAMKEISAVTDLLVSFKEKKAGRMVTALEFTIKTKDGFMREAQQAALREEGRGLYERLIGHGLKEDQANKYIELYGESDPARIKENIAKLEAELKAGKVKNASAWLRRAIDEDYRDQKSLFQVSNEEAQREANARRDEQKVRMRQISALDAQIEKHEDLYFKHRQAFVLQTIAVLSAKEREGWETEFGDALEEGFFKVQWRQKREWGNRLTLSKAEKFITQKTGKSVEGQDAFLKGQGLASIEELYQKREALL